jgi:hypothetical protein
MSHACPGAALAGVFVALLVAGWGCGGDSGEGSKAADTPEVGDACDPGDVVKVNQLPENLDCDQVDQVIVAEGDPCDDEEHVVRPTGAHLICDTSATVRVKGQTSSATPRLIRTPEPEPEPPREPVNPPGPAGDPCYPGTEPEGYICG